MNGTWGIDPDYDEHQELNKAFDHLQDLDAVGCALVLRIAEVLADYQDWNPADADQFTSFQALATDLLWNPDTLAQMLPLIEARATYQREVAEAEAQEPRTRKLYRRKQPAAPVLRLVPKEDGPPDQPGA